MKLRFRAHVNIARATFRPEALNSSSIGGFFVHRDFENVEQYQQARPVEEASRRVAPPRPTQKRPKDRELGKREDEKEGGGEGGSGVGGKDKGKVEAKKIGREGEKKKKKVEKKKNERGKGPKGSEGAIGGEEIKDEVKTGENGIVKMGKGEGKKKAKKDVEGKVMKKKGDDMKGKVSGEGDVGAGKSLGLIASREDISEAGNPIFSTMGDKVGKDRSKGAIAKPPVKSAQNDIEYSEAENPLFATMGDKVGKERSKGGIAKPPAKSSKKDKAFSEAGNPLFATMDDKKGKKSTKDAVAKSPVKSTKKDKGGFSEAGNPLFATMGDKEGKENSKGAVAKVPAKPAKKEVGRRMFMKKNKDVEESPKIEVVAPKPRKLPPVDKNAPSARNPLLQYKDRQTSGQLQVKTNLHSSNDADSGDEFDA